MLVKARKALWQPGQLTTSRFYRNIYVLTHANTSDNLTERSVTTMHDRVISHLRSIR